MSPQLQALDAAGQSIWLDNIRRNMFASGDLHSLIDAGLRGMTSNPTIFEKAIGSGNDYDEQLAGLIGTEHDPNRLFEALADRRYPPRLRRISPALRSDRRRRRFRQPRSVTAAGGRYAADQRRRQAPLENGRPAERHDQDSGDARKAFRRSRETIAAGINVNVTLIFSLETYEDTANAYIAGLEQRAAAGESIERIASVASVFVSRIDTAVDKLLEEKIAKGQPQLKALLGKTGIANLKLIYRALQEHLRERTVRAAQSKGRAACNGRCGRAPARRIPRTPTCCTSKTSSGKTP